MKTEKITREQVELFANVRNARDKKNEGTREENNAKKVLNLSIPSTGEKVECSYMHAGKPIAIIEQGERFDIDREKLQADFPEAYKACYLPKKTYTLNILV